MHVSRNELRSLLKQALEGLGLARGDVSGPAEQLLWTAQHQLIEWSGFDGLLARLSNRSPDPIPQPINSKEPFLRSIDARGASLGVLGTPEVDLSIAQALENAFSTTRILNCQDTELLAPKLVSASRRGLVGAVFGRFHQNGKSDQVKTRVFSVSASDPHPTVLDAPELDRLEEGALVMVFARTCERLNDYMSRFWPEIIEHRSTVIDQQDFAARELDSIQSGIHVPRSSWDALVTLAAKTLVPSDEQSRMGAGD